MQTMEVAPKQTSEKRSSRTRRSTPNYCIYLSKIQKQVQPSLQIKKKAIAAVNSIVENVLDKLIAESAVSAIASKKSTLAAKHVQAATKSLLSGELAKHAVSEGTAAVSKFSSK